MLTAGLRMAGCLGLKVSLAEVLLACTACAIQAGFS
jgi:hypothetical protein